MSKRVKNGTASSDQKQTGRQFMDGSLLSKGHLGDGEKRYNISGHQPPCMQKNLQYDQSM